MPASLDVVVLAAGRGLRLGTVNRGRPKALLTLAGASLVAHAIDFATRFAPRRIVVVTGFGHEGVAAEVLRVGHAAAVVAHNADFDGGNLASLRVALPHLEGSRAVLVTNVDHLFAPSATAAISAGFTGGVTAGCQFDRAVADDEMKVTIDDTRRLVAIGKTLPRFAGAYIGLTHVGADAQLAWRDALDTVARQRGAAAVAEDVLQALAHQRAVATSALDGIAWQEIDTPDDLARATAWLGQRRA